MSRTEESGRFDPASEHRRALEDVRDDRPRAAVDRLTALISRRPRHAAAMSDLAVLLHGLGRTPEALRLLHRACSFDPDRVDAWENLLDLLGLTGSAAEARRVARSWLCQRPWEPVAHARAEALGVLVAPAASDRETGSESTLETTDTTAASAPEIVAGDVADLLGRLAVSNGRAPFSHPFTAVIESDDPLGALAAEEIAELAAFLDQGNARLLTRSATAARRCARAGLDVWATLDDVAPETHERIRRDLGARTVIVPPDAVRANVDDHESAIDPDLTATVIRLLSRHLPDRTDRTILDVETTGGSLLTNLSALGDVVATSPVARHVEVARECTGDHRIQVHPCDLLRSDDALEPFGRFDGVTCVEALGRLARHEREGALLALAELIPPDGVIVIGFPNRARPDLVPETGAVARTLREIEHDARAFGFEVLETAGVGSGKHDERPLLWIAALRPTAATVARPREMAESMLPPSRGAGDPGRPPLPVLKRLGPEVADASTTTVPPLLWCGAMLTPGGYATYNRNSVLWLRRSGVHVGGRSHDEPDPDFLSTLPLPDLFELKASLRERIRNGIMLVNYQPALPTGQNIYRQMRWQHPEQLAYVGLTTFETDTMPPHWVAAANEMDEIWVPSSFSIDAFARAGVDRAKLKAIGFAIDPTLYDPASLPPAEIPDRRGFVFYSVFQWHGRKGWPVLIEAFAKAFGPDDDVQLVLKTMPGAKGRGSVDDQIDAHIAGIGLSRDRVAPIHVIDVPISEEDLRRLYFAADAFVLPTRGEGWGIPYMEAMACGLPTIGTRWSGHLDFMNDDNSYLIDVRGLVPVDREMLEFSREYTGQKYADPDPDHLVALLRQVRENPDEARVRGQSAYRDIRENWTPERYCARVLAAAGRLAARIADRRRPAEGRAREDRVPPVTVRGSLFEASGASHDARSIAAQIARLDVPLEVASRFDRQRIQPVRDDDAALILDHAMSPSVVIESGDPYQMLPPREDAVNVARLTTWGDRLPARWLPTLSTRDEIWVTNRLHLGACRRAGIPRNRLRLVPVGVDLDRFRPDVDPLPLGDTSGFRFLACLDLSARKGLDALLAAFFGEFSPDDDVSLVLNVAPNVALMCGEIRNHVQRLARRHARMRWGHASLPITFLHGDVEPEDMPRLYRAAGAYVLPTRAGSVGLTALEAMACGTPVVALSRGVHRDFLDEENALLVASDLVPVSVAAREEEPELRGQQWAEPRLDDFRRQLRALASDASLRARLSRRGRERVESKHGMNAVRGALHGEIRRIGRTADGSRSSPPTVRVCWRGPHDDHGSLALVNRALATQLEAYHDVAVDRRPPGDTEPSDTDVVVSHSWPPAFLPPPGTRRHVVILPWEYGRIPARWVEEIERGVDELWVPTHHVFEGLVASGVPAEMIHVVPNGVDHEILRPQGPVISLPTDRSFRFLYVGGAIWRKGLDLLVDAYDRTFRPQDDVCLVVKTCGDHGVYRKCSGLQQLAVRAGMPDRPPLVVVDEDLTDVEMGALYRACHALVHPYRAEGFAMPVAEAAACGLPVVVTRGGATTDFITASTGFLVASERVPFTTEAPYEADGWVLEPDPQDLVRALLEVHGDRREAQNRGRLASSALRSAYRWRVVAGIAAARLRATPTSPKTGRSERSAR